MGLPSMITLDYTESVVVGLADMGSKRGPSSLAHPSDEQPRLGRQGARSPSPQYLWV